MCSLWCTLLMLHISCLLFSLIEVSTAAENGKVVDYSGLVCALVINTEIFYYRSFNDNISTI